MVWTEIHLNTALDSPIPHGFHAFCTLMDRRTGQPRSLDVYLLWCPFDYINGPDGLDFLMVTRPEGRPIKALLPLWRFEPRRVRVRDGILTVRGHSLQFRRGADVSTLDLPPVASQPVPPIQETTTAMASRLLSLMSTHLTQMVLSPDQSRVAIMHTPAYARFLRSPHSCVLQILDTAALPSTLKEVRRIALPGSRILAWRSDGIVLESLYLLEPQRRIWFDRPQRYLLDARTGRASPLTSEAKRPAEHFLAQLEKRLDDDGRRVSFGSPHPLDFLERLGDPSVIPALEAMAKRARSEGLREAILRTVRELRGPTSRQTD